MGFLTMPNNLLKNRAILLLVCPDQPGIVSRISQFIFEHGGNIVDSDQHSDGEASVFFMRIEWELENFKLSRGELEKGIKKLMQGFKSPPFVKGGLGGIFHQHQIFYTDTFSRMAIFVSKYPHCLYDLLMRHQLGEIQVEIPLIISNHADLKPVAEHFKIPFHEIFIDSKNKQKAETEQLALLKKYKIDLIVLARYMQILSKKFVQTYPHQMINIHHSFLPAFVGATPYAQAYARGVKVIGATSHYVTENLDEGPIIEQSVTRVSHRDRVEDLIRKGRDQEKVALAHAVRMHLEHRILTYGNKTIVFE